MLTAAATTPTTYHYIICRRDMPLGDICAQTIHAAGESASRCGPLPAGTHAIALAARDEEHLLTIAALLARREIHHVLIREPDAPYNGAACAIGIYPTTDRAPIRKALSSLPLLKE